MNAEPFSSRRSWSGSELAFLDSNVIIYIFDADDARKRDIARELVERSLSSGIACISYQVVQEVINTATHSAVMSSDDAERLLHNVLVPLWRVMPSEALHENALRIHERYGYSYYDSLIVAAALEAGRTTLFSEDMQDGQRIETLTIRNPFAA